MTCYDLPWQFSRGFHGVPHMILVPKGSEKGASWLGMHLCMILACSWECLSVQVHCDVWQISFDCWANEWCGGTCAVGTNEALQTRAKSFRDSICQCFMFPNAPWACSVHTSLVNDGAWCMGSTELVTLQEPLETFDQHFAQVLWLWHACTILYTCVCQNAFTLSILSELRLAAGWTWPAALSGCLQTRRLNTLYHDSMLSRTCFKIELLDQETTL